MSLTETNRRFYERLWSEAQLVEPQRFNTWPLVSELAARARRMLEVAPGLRPRLPLDRAQFVDISRAAMTRFRSRGAAASVGIIHALPFADGAFDFVCSFDIVEHVDDDETAFAELARVAAPGAALLLSVPLHASAWTPFDDFVGHRRRYEPNDLADKLARHGFAIERSAVFGMQPKSSRLLDLGMWFLTHQRERAMWWYNRVFMPLGLRMQKPLQWKQGFHDEPGIDTTLLICRKQG
ncbi:class I SAM-dependent methyltransferase [Oleiagrimonas soli]|uniref:SAM-dependent methyltransferase n=1 Tax=Oleiagrimonas soli TaxID=1543381 RepID=A0A841KDJ2_9GAMM|nr:class I SAM-dependent methyltransferase [Oleiagrimonas soli]MBB6183060.1 SAM-dependent methyltransferase [Oleiagrimonas soli]